jgi:oligopeptide transport system ATP-binding protein
MEKILEVNDLQVSFDTYAGEVKAVRGVSFDLYKGECIGIVGESGCGKSVTAQTIMRLIPQPPARIKNGSILFKDQDLTKLSEMEMLEIRGSEIGIIFQDPMTSLNPTMKIGRQITEGLIKNRNMKPHIAWEHAIKMLGLAGIPNPEDRVNQYPHQLSGGMRQRVMIAIALASNPSLLIADEPTTALDVTIQAQILKLMKDLQSHFDASIIMITHDLGVIAHMCERVIVMYAGQVVETGTIKEIFHTPKHPYTKGLLKSIPRLDQNRDEDLIPINGSPPDLIKPPEGCAFCDRCAYAMEICKFHDPEETQISSTQSTRCWLEHPMAKEA